MPMSSSQMLGCLLFGGLLLTLVSRSESPPDECTTWPIPGGHERIVQASKIDLVCFFHHQVTLSWTGIPMHVGPIMVGLWGLFQQVVTNPLFCPNCQIVEDSHHLLQAVSFYQPWPVCWPKGHFWTGVWTCIFKDDPPPGPHRAGWGCPSSGLCWWVHLPPGSHRAEESTHFLAKSPGLPSTGAVCPWGLAGRCLMWLLKWPWLLEHLLLPNWWQLPDCLWLPCCPWEMEWLSHSICPSSIAAVASAWWWKSLTAHRASSQDSCCLLWWWPKYS